MGRSGPNSTAEMPLLYGITHQITMKRTNGRYKGQHFYHDFTSKTASYGLPKGAIVILPSGRAFRLTTRTVILVSEKDIWAEFL